MASYFKNEKVCKFPNWHIYFARHPGHMTKFFRKTCKISRSHRHIIYTADISLNSVPRGPTYYMVGNCHLDDPPTNGAQTGCHDNDGCLTMGPRTLHLMAAYNKKHKGLYNSTYAHMLKMSFR